MDDEKPSQNAKSKSVTSQHEGGPTQVSRLGKGHEGYWSSRLRKRGYRSGSGDAKVVPEWQVQLGRDGRQRWVNLGTSNKAAAAKKARDCWIKLQSGGWDAVKPAREEIVDPNVGQFLAAVRAEADLDSRTFGIYARKFRRLVAGVFGIRGDKRKFDHAAGGYAKWLARIEAVKFSRLTARAVQRWKTKYIAEAAVNPVRERCAKRTVASVLRSSKALFSPTVVGKLHLRLSSPLPLAAIDVPRVSAAQYVSSIDPELLFQIAQRELDVPRPEASHATSNVAHVGEVDTGVARGGGARLIRECEKRRQAFRALCLALFAGLRRDEIDTLTWKQIDFANHTIRIETNEFTRAKSDGSEAAVDIDPTLSEMLRACMAASRSQFVIEVGVAPRPNASSYHHYRCSAVFATLTAWLKVRGIEGRNPLHALRKEFGTQINRSHGLFAASAALRHSSIQLTRSVYVAKKDRAVFSVPQSARSPVAIEERFRAIGS